MTTNSTPIDSTAAGTDAPTPRLEYYKDKFIALGYWPNEVLWKVWTQAIDAVNPEIATANARAKQLDELLCIIHRDGGHYIVNHGEQKAFDDACRKCHDWKLFPDDLEAERKARESAQMKWHQSREDMKQLRNRAESAELRLRELEAKLLTPSSFLEQFAAIAAATKTDKD